MRMPPLPADSIHARACKLKCEKILTRPRDVMKKKLLRIFSSVLCLCMLTTACGGGTEDAGNGDDGGEAKDTLTIAVQADMADKDPINGSSTNDTLKIKAIAYALDIDGAWEVCMDGVGQPAEGLLPSNIPDSIADVDSPYHVDYPVYEYNLEKAKELLAEAGYPDGFSCRYHVGHMAVRQAYGEFFANALGQIGIDVEIVALDAATNSQALKVEHNFDIYTWGISATNGDIDYANRFFYTDNANNIFGYSDPEMDALIDAAAMEADSAKRSELNAEIQQKVLDECVIVPIYQQEDIHCYTSDLQGFRNGAFQAPLLKYCYFA